MATTFRSKLSACVAQANPSLDTRLLFDASYLETTASPIDEFLTRLGAINRLCPAPASFDPLQGQLVMLGVIAAVESYLRSVLRRLISVDQHCQDSVNRRDVSYGAAMHLSKQMLPEAMLERISFVSRSSIVEAMRDLIGIKGNLPSDLDVSIDDYARICQLRHCAVHRFGKLGVSNAISLGLDGHKELLEKPLRLNYPSLQNAVAISTGFVKTVNNFLFNEAISRIPSSRWTEVFRSDKKLFNIYYSIFTDTVSSTRSTNDLRQTYQLLMNQRRSFASGQPF